MASFRAVTGSAIIPARVMRGVTGMTIENPMVLDWWWDESEYGVPNKSREEREDEEYETN